MYTAGKPACSIARAVRQSYAPGATTSSSPASSSRSRAAADIALQRLDAGLRDLHVLAPVRAADPDPADHLVVDRDREAAPEPHEPVDARRRAGGQRRVVLDEVVPAVGRHPEARRRVGLVLGDLDAEQGRAVHAAVRLQHPAVVDDRDHERLAHVRGLALGRRDHPVRRLRADAALAERLSHRLSSPWWGRDRIMAPPRRARPLSTDALSIYRYVSLTHDSHTGRERSR